MGKALDQRGIDKLVLQLNRFGSNKGRLRPRLAFDAGNKVGL